MLPGLIVAYPHPSAISCSIAGGSDGAGGAPPGRPGPADPPPVGPKPRAGAGGAPGAGGIPERPPNIIVTGTGRAAFAGVTRVIWISTVRSGYAELSAAPISSLPTTGRPPTWNCSVRLTRHATVGTVRGTRPSTSRSKSSTISGRRCFHHASALVTFLPFLSVSGSGSSGYGLATASS